jgi:hypothetical protein
MVTTLDVIISPIALIVETGLTLMGLNVVYACERESLFPDLLIQRLRSSTILFGIIEIKIKNGLVCLILLKPAFATIINNQEYLIVFAYPGGNILNRLARPLK